MLYFSTDSYPNLPIHTRREAWPNYFKKKSQTGTKCDFQYMCQPY